MAAWLLGGSASADAQQATEIGAEGLATFSDPILMVAGLYGAVRSSERVRISALLGGGSSDEDFAWRGELMGNFLLSPLRRHGWGSYLAGGLAAVGGPVSRGYLVLALGIEESPGASGGWAGELGIGGGVRLAVGYRWRRLRSR